MASPPTVTAAGFFAARRAGTPIGDATLMMTTATQGTLALGGVQYAIGGDPAAKRLHGTAAGSILDLKIKTRSLLNGTVDGAPLELTRSVLRPIPAAEMAQSDPGPTGAIKTVMDATLDYKAAVGDSNTFWYAFGPCCTAGLDGSARVLGIASDPGPSECLPFARRTLIGDSGQKTQGFLAKLGLTRSYVLVNAFAVALHPGKKTKGLQVLRTNAAITASRHALYNALLAGGSLRAIVAFGDVAQLAYDLWAASNPAVAAVPVVKIGHPAAVDRTGSGDDPVVEKVEAGRDDAARDRDPGPGRHRHRPELRRVRDRTRLHAHSALGFSVSDAGIRRRRLLGPRRQSSGTTTAVSGPRQMTA